MQLTILTTLAASFRIGLTGAIEAMDIEPIDIGPSNTVLLQHVLGRTRGIWQV
jgi:hypothetical protein